MSIPGLDPGAGGGEIIEVLTFNTAADERVCPICAPWHGFSAPADEFPSSLIPPLHGNCRCYITSGTVLLSADEAAEFTDNPDTSNLLLAGDDLDDDDEDHGDYDPDTVGVGPWEEDVEIDNLPPTLKGKPVS